MRSFIFRSLVRFAPLLLVVLASFFRRRLTLVDENLSHPARRLGPRRRIAKRAHVATRGHVARHRTGRPPSKAR